MLLQLLFYMLLLYCLWTVVLFLKLQFYLCESIKVHFISLFFYYFLTDLIMNKTTLPSKTPFGDYQQLALFM